MSPRRQVDEQRLRALFEEVDAPASLDRWRVRAEAGEPPAPRPLVARPRVRVIAAAAAAFAVVVGLGGVVVTNQLLTDEPPATPPMIIDGPDRLSTPPSGDRSVPSSPPPSAGRTVPPSGPPSGADRRDTDRRGGSVDGGVPAPPPPPGDGGPPGEVEPPPMVGYPSATNAGVPADTTLRDHHGDLHITQPGTVVSGLRVDGTIVVDAPDVTLRRVMVFGTGGIAIRQTARAPRLTVELSDLTGQVVQQARGLTIRRCVTGGIAGLGDLSLVDTYVASGKLRVSAGSAHILVRHNTVEEVELADASAPITDVTVENNSIGHVRVPTQPGSADIRVWRNVFRTSPASTGWNEEAPGYEWAGNTDQSGAPVGP